MMIIFFIVFINKIGKKLIVIFLRVQRKKKGWREGKREMEVE